MAMHGLPESYEFSASIEHLARWSLEDPVDDEEKPSAVAYNFSENVSSVVECGTGEIYLIHSGVKKGNFGALTFYRLSHVRWESGVGPQLEPIAWGTVAHDPACKGRASATVWADGSGGMELYCSEYRMKTRRDDSIRFTRRYLP
ncbi:MAG: hypothetical protein D6705_17790 [Deltaproteobacteria bacterium]|nr:MAG: hypothetical protein D6705_17790 [Deltaproteobacteria bacterium]